MQSEGVCYKIHAWTCNMLKDFFSALLAEQ